MSGKQLMKRLRGLRRQKQQKETDISDIMVVPVVWFEKMENGYWRLDANTSYQMPSMAPKPPIRKSTGRKARVINPNLSAKILDELEQEQTSKREIGTCHACGHKMSMFPFPDDGWRIACRHCTSGAYRKDCHHCNPTN